MSGQRPPLLSADGAFLFKAFVFKWIGPKLQLLSYHSAVKSNIANAASLHWMQLCGRGCIYGALALQPPPV